MLSCPAGRDLGGGEGLQACAQHPFLLVGILDAAPTLAVEVVGEWMDDLCASGERALPALSTSGQ